MTTILNLPLQQANPEIIKDLQEKFPNANLRIEVNKKTAPHGNSRKNTKPHHLYAITYFQTYKILTNETNTYHNPHFHQY